MFFYQTNNYDYNSFFSMLIPMTQTHLNVDIYVLNQEKFLGSQSCCLFRLSVVVFPCFEVEAAGEARLLKVDSDHSWWYQSLISSFMYGGDGCSSPHLQLSVFTRPSSPSVISCLIVSCTCAGLKGHRGDL